MGKTIAVKVSAEIIEYQKLIDELLDINENLERCLVSISSLVYKYFHAETNLGVLALMSGLNKRITNLISNHENLLNKIRIKIDGKPRRTSKPGQSE